MIITIDGPTASGKSTVARLLAERLGFYYLNTGMLYRAISYLLTTRYGYTQDQLADPIKSDVQALLDSKHFVYQFKQGTARLLFKGEDITPFLKTKENDQAASIVSGNPMVRQELLEFQRQFARMHDIVAEGRDTGTVIFPKAASKIYLTASVEERAKRWLRYQKKAKGNTYTCQEAIAQIEERDKRDSQRATAPLRVPSGAIVIDNSHMDKQQTLQLLEEHIAKVVKK